MARTRTVSPLAWEDLDLARCSERARLLFFGLLNLADREGRLPDVPPWIRAKLFPYEELEIDSFLDELARMREFSDGSFIERYEVGEKKYIQINNFLKYQKPHPREVASVIPPPGGGGVQIAQSESFYRDKWAHFLKGQIEVQNKVGVVDIETETHVWEVKEGRSLKAAFQQAIAYAQCSGKKAGVILFGHVNEESARTLGEELGVEVRFQLPESESIDDVCTDDSRVMDESCINHTKRVQVKPDQSLPSSSSLPSFPSSPASSKRAPRNGQGAVWWESESGELHCTEEWWERMLEVFDPCPPSVLKETWVRLELYIRARPKDWLPGIEKSKGLEPWVEAKLRQDAANAIRQGKGSGPPLATPMRGTADEVLAEQARKKRERGYG